MARSVERGVFATRSDPNRTGAGLSGNTVTTSTTSAPLSLANGEFEYNADLRSAGGMNPSRGSVDPGSTTESDEYAALLEQLRNLNLGSVWKNRNHVYQ